MSIWIDAAVAAAGINAILLAVLGAVWVQNYRRLGSKHTLGMVVFAALLLVENLFAVYFYLLDPVRSVWFSTAVPDVAWQALLSFHGLELVALLFLTWVTLD